jgi:L-seryl-tRNA(Ser) seleniumtransferase
MADAAKNARLRGLPSVDQVLADPALAPTFEGHPRVRAVTAARLALGAARGRLLNGDARGLDRSDLEEALARLETSSLRPVLNATGVVLHTNLGRAPLPEEALAQAVQVAQGYCNLELDLEEGERGSRYDPVVELLRGLTGAEDACVVNNNAAAVLLVLAALARGRQAIVSRGELVEIGGGFRVPDVMAQSGVLLVEVGTTNRTRLSDYELALTPQTALLVKVHRSNFAIVGFTQEVSSSALATLGRARGLPVFEDLGSGSLLPLVAEGLTPEPTVRDKIKAGVSLVSFSGDKLLGGPQAGIIVGERALLAQVKAHPLNRALRVDKLTVSVLEATLRLYRDGRTAQVPVVQLLTQSSERLRERASRLASLLLEQGVKAEVVPTEGQVGGGAMPLSRLPSYACALDGYAPQRAQDQLRTGEPPVISRIDEGRVLLDVRCLAEGELRPVALAVACLSQDEPC